MHRAGNLCNEHAGRSEPRREWIAYHTSAFLPRSDVLTSSFLRGRPRLLPPLYTTTASRLVGVQFESPRTSVNRKQERNAHLLELSYSVPCHPYSYRWQPRTTLGNDWWNWIAHPCIHYTHLSFLIFLTIYIKKNLNKARIDSAPARTIQFCSVIKRDRQQPRIWVDGNQRQPVFLSHTISGKVNSQAGLRKLGWNFLGRQVHRPGAVYLSYAAHPRFQSDAWTKLPCANVFLAFRTPTKVEECNTWIQTFLNGDSNPM